jgi:hypothetical protein
MRREDEHIQAQLAALADGSLASSRREPLTAEVQERPELSDGLQRQRDAVAILRSLEETPAPVSLHRAVESLVDGASQRRHCRASWRPRALMPAAARRRRALLPATALAATCAAAVAIALSGQAGGAPTVLQASRVALRPATLAAPRESASDSNALDVSVEGVDYPYWQGSLGWQAVGARHDRLAGRDVTTVYYGSHYAPAGTGRLAYAIVGGKALPQPGGTAVSDGGIQFHVLDLHGATVLTWRRAGHTCIMVARDVPVRTLMRLASWQ